MEVVKYGQYAIKNTKGQYIKHGTAYRYTVQWTKSLYDAALWPFKEDAEKLAGFMGQEVAVVLV